MPLAVSAECGRSLPDKIVKSRRVNRLCNSGASGAGEGRPRRGLTNWPDHGKRLPTPIIPARSVIVRCFSSALSDRWGRPVRTRGAHHDRSTLASPCQRRPVGLGPGPLCLLDRKGQPLRIEENRGVLRPDAVAVLRRPRQDAREGDAGRRARLGPRHRQVGPDAFGSSSILLMRRTGLLACGPRNGPYSRGQNEFLQEAIRAQRFPNLPHPSGK